MDEFNIPESINAPGSRIVAACKRQARNVAEEILQNELLSPRRSDAEEIFPIVLPLVQRLNDSDWAWVLDLILKYDPDILLATDRDGQTALSWAADYAEIKSVQRLLQTKQIPRNDMVKALLQVGGKCRWLKFDSDSSSAADRVIRLLIENGVDVARRYEGAIPLTHAVQLESVYVVEWLCRNSSSLVPEAFTSRDDEGRSPLSIAVLNKHDWAIVLLLNTGHYDRDHDNYGRTPLYWLLQSKMEETQKRKLAKILIWKEAHYDVRGVFFKTDELGGVQEPEGDMHVDPGMLNQYHKNDGLTLLSHAAQLNEEKVIRTILKISGIEADAPNRDSTTPLHVALVGNKTEAAKALMEADKSTFKRLISDSRRDDGAIGLLKRLLELGYDVNREMDKGQPLHMSALELAQGNLQLMCLIIPYCAGLKCLTISKDDWFELGARHAASRGRTWPRTGTESGLLVKRGGNGELEIKFEDLETVTPSPCCPNNDRINSEISILVHRDRDTWRNPAEYPPEQYECCGRQWRSYHISLEFPSRDREDRKLLLGIEWTMEATENGEPGRVLYSSTLPKVWLPRNLIEFLDEFLKELSSQWQRVCGDVDQRMISNRLNSQSPNSSRSSLFNELEKDYVYLAKLRAALSLHIEDVRRQFPASRRDYFDHIHLGDSIERLQETTINKLDQFEQVVTGILQLQFARASINEAATIRRITLVTFVYLPLMFSASLFGMNVNALENNPDWRWYLLFAGASFLVTFGIYYYPFTGIWLPQSSGTRALVSTSFLNRRKVARARSSGSAV
ncbi:uncharacterized protein APUU_20507A [Aspergillus puulaauensis]|uniref:Ankyrin repeat-containing domain protein n=1 Tax=Aspergillus puulaauensis TaxID=1220207 RepID=A0A7R7XEW6_9EURO|nr:uncharacterized protein APUU_20507A [Aspergillus puulaauensis]BCS20075.1 hypothetical protein APUU_20507A [Aspergillus puulaauensis]